MLFRSGAGADGQVVTALSPNGDAVAIKRFPLDTKVRKNIFQNEAFFSRILSKGGITVPTHDIFATPTDGYLVMQLGAKDLLDVVEGSEDGCLPVRQSLKIFAEVCQLVARLHQRRIAHLDIKPENILIDDEGVLRLCDFSRAHQWSTDKRYDGLLNSISTKEYSSPERFVDDFFDVTAADVFSLGVLLHVMLTGYFPFSPLRKDDCSFPRPVSLTHAEILLDKKGVALLRWMLEADPSARPTVPRSSKTVG